MTTTPELMIAVDAAVQRALAKIRQPQVMPATVSDVGNGKAVVHYDGSPPGELWTAESFVPLLAPGDRVWVWMQPPSFAAVLGRQSATGQRGEFPPVVLATDVSTAGISTAPVALNGLSGLEFTVPAPRGSDAFEPWMVSLFLPYVTATDDYQAGLMGIVDTATATTLASSIVTCNSGGFGSGYLEWPVFWPGDYNLHATLQLGPTMAGTLASGSGTATTVAVFKAHPI